jgi:hypothetical protein
MLLGLCTLLPGKKTLILGSTILSTNPANQKRERTANKTSAMDDDVVPDWVANGAALKWENEKREAETEGKKRRRKERKKETKKMKKRERDAAKEAAEGSDSDEVAVVAPLPVKKKRATGADAPSAKASCVRTMHIGTFFGKKPTAPAPATATAPAPAAAATAATVPVTNTDARPAQAPTEGPAAPTPPTDAPAPTPTEGPAAPTPPTDAPAPTPTEGPAAPTPLTKGNKYKKMVGGDSKRAEEAAKAGLDVDKMATVAARNRERCVEVNTGGDGMKIHKQKSMYTDTTKCSTTVHERANQYKDQSFIVTGGSGVQYALLCQACNKVMPDTFKQPCVSHIDGKGHKKRLVAFNAQKEKQMRMSDHVAQQVATSTGSKLPLKVCAQGLVRYLLSQTFHRYH